MKEFFKNLLSDNGNVSSMRVMAFTSLISAISMAFYGLQKHSDLYGLATLVGVFVAASFGGKVAQKFRERSDKRDGN